MAGTSPLVTLNNGLAMPILGFGGHADTAGLRRAHEAGFDQVLVKNALQERAPQIVQELTASVE